MSTLKIATAKRAGFSHSFVIVYWDTESVVVPFDGDDHYAKTLADRLRSTDRRGFLRMLKGGLFVTAPMREFTITEEVAEFYISHVILESIRLELEG